MKRVAGANVVVGRQLLVAVLIVGLNLMLGACLPGAKVSLEGDRNYPVFTISRGLSLKSRGPCIRQAAAFEVSEGAGERLIWQIISLDQCQVTDKVYYSGANPGMSVAKKTENLITGKMYKVYIGGAGFAGSVKFTVRDDSLFVIDN